jgi:hypothetical protein
MNLQKKWGEAKEEEGIKYEIQNQGQITIKKKLTQRNNVPISRFMCSAGRRKYISFFFPSKPGRQWMCLYTGRTAYLQITGPFLVSTSPPSYSIQTVSQSNHTLSMLLTR